jgi:hypothetical protein
MHRSGGMTVRRSPHAARVIETTGVEILEHVEKKPPVANDAEEAPPPPAKDEPVIPFASTLRHIA